MPSTELGLAEFNALLVDALGSDVKMRELLEKEFTAIFGAFRDAVDALAEMEMSDAAREQTLKIRRTISNMIFVSDQLDELERREAAENERSV